MEILASLDDINANLPSEEEDSRAIEATDENAALVQVSVSRIVRGYLSAAIDSATLMSWNLDTDPDSVPDIIREIAGKLIAAQVYINHVGRSTVNMDDTHFAQRLYNTAIGLLDKILTGEIALVETPVESTTSLTLEDGFPVDATGRAFTIGMEL